MAGFVIDTSAMIAYLRGEEGDSIVMDLLRDASNSSGTVILVPFAALMETEHKLARTYSQAEAEQAMSAIESLPMRVRESDPTWRRMAANVKATYRLSFADAWMAALALLEDAELIHKDPEFDLVTGLKALRLPYTSRLSKEDDPG